MSEKYISASKLKAHYSWLGKDATLSPKDVDDIIDAQAAADVEPVVRGEWIKYKFESGREAKFYMCSVCEKGNPLDGQGNEWFTDFCPHCGAHMMERSGSGE